MIKTKNKILATPANAAAKVVKPKIHATIESAKNISTAVNIYTPPITGFIQPRKN